MAEAVGWWRGVARRHARHHGRFYLAVLAGVASWLLAAGLGPRMRWAIAGDVLFASYVGMMAALTARGTADAMRRRASVADEGLAIVVVLTLAAVGLSLVTLFSTINAQPAPGRLELALSLSAVALGWVMLHTVASFHYARLYYRETGPGQIAGGLAFPETTEPTAWDFLYQGFVVGMTAQVADVQVTSTAMRRATLAHAFAAFFYNTVLVALAVNIAVSLGR